MTCDEVLATIAQHADQGVTIEHAVTKHIKTSDIHPENTTQPQSL
jgi:hypothetical protein